MSSTYPFLLNDHHSTLKKIKLNCIFWRILKLILGSQKEHSSLSVLLIYLQYCPGEKMWEWQHTCGCHSSPNSDRQPLTLQSYFPIIHLYSCLSYFTISISKKKEIYVTEKGELWGYALKTGPNLKGKKKWKKCLTKFVKNSWYWH